HDQRGGAAALLLVGALLVSATAAPVLAHGMQGSGGPAGLGRRDPLRAAGLSLALLSLAGAPPLAGVFGEFAVAAELVRSGRGRPPLACRPLRAEIESGEPAWSQRRGGGPGLPHCGPDLGPAGRAPGTAAGGGVAGLPGRGWGLGAGRRQPGDADPRLPGGA